jgi:cytidylate kinase
MSTASDKRICVICAWRGECTKRFRVKTNALYDVNCPDYTRDIKLKDKDITKMVEEHIERWSKEYKRRPTNITISREAGAGAGWIARIVAASLGMDLIGSEMIHQVAQSAHMSEKVIKSLDEKSISLLDSVISSFFENRHIWPNEYMRHLSIVIHATANYGNAIMIGRGANLVLGDAAFRVRIIAPQELRIENVIRDRRISYEEAKKYVVDLDTNMIAFVRKYFNEDIANPAHYDMLINTQHVSIESAADSIKQSFLEWKSLQEKEAVRLQN